MDTQTKNTGSRPGGDQILEGEDQELPIAQLNPWEEYFTGKEIPAQRFLAKIVKTAIVLPDQSTRNRMADAIVANPRRLRRLMKILPAAASVGGTVHRIAIDIAQSTIGRFGLTPLADAADQATFEQWISLWLTSISERPLKPRDLGILLLAFNLGRERALLDNDSAIDLIASAVNRPPKKRKTPVTSKAMFPLDVILQTTPAASTLSALTAHTRAWQQQVSELERQLRIQCEEAKTHKTIADNLAVDVSGLQAEVADTRERLDEARASIATHEKRMVDFTDGWRHKMEQVRGRTRGVMQGQLTRWLQTALDAARSDPPFMAAVEERLEESLRLINGELKWLQHSD